MKCKKIACNCEIEKGADKNEVDYRVEGKYHVANFDTSNVAYAINFSDPGKFPIRALFNKKTIKESMLGQTWRALALFVIGYMVIQMLYQTDVICKLMFTTPEVATNMTGCHEEFIDKIERYKLHDGVASRYITLILGFYVVQVVQRWSIQVQKLPDMRSVMNYIAGVIYPTDNNSSGALNLSKKLARYCLLSWTMCLSSVSSPLNRSFQSSEDYIKKQLLTEEEFAKLKSNNGSIDGWKDQWGIPITWAIKHVNNNFNYPKAGGGQGLIPKDHNKLVGALTAFRKGLEDVIRYQHNPLPLIYKQTVLVAVWSWMILGIVATQDLKNRPWFLAIFLNFPVYSVIKYGLILGWLRVAEFIRNPFETDRKNRTTTTDICLEDVLDAEIWKASVRLQNINQSVFVTG